MGIKIRIPSDTFQQVMDLASYFIVVALISLGITFALVIGSGDEVSPQLATALVIVIALGFAWCVVDWLKHADNRHLLKGMFNLKK